MITLNYHSPSQRQLSPLAHGFLQCCPAEIQWCEKAKASECPALFVNCRLLFFSCPLPPSLRNKWHLQVIQESTLSINLSNRRVCKCFSMCVHGYFLFFCTIKYCLHSMGSGYCQNILGKFNSSNLIRGGQTQDSVDLKYFTQLFLDACL